MRNKIGTLFMILGAALVLSALALFLYNQREAAQAEQVAAAQLSQLVAEIGQQEELENTEVILPGTPVELMDPSAFEMTEVIIDGHAYIGYLSIPSLNLELPIMSGWDYTKLRIAPCRYYGSVMGEDLVLMAHNYKKHFGTISKLSVGDSVIFVDMDGVTTQYEVVAQEVLTPKEVEEMTAGEYDLTLFTCTYGGKSRVTVRCDKVE